MDLVKALINLLTPWQLFLTFLGTWLGILVGVMPGINGSMLIALMLPITFKMAPIDAMNLLVSVYTGAVTGGLITATLLRIPGEPSNVMTTFDAHPMAARGEAGRALGLGIFASTFGALFAWVALATLTRPLAELAVKFSPFDYFALTLSALVLMAAVSKGSMSKGLLAGMFGVLVSFPGVDPSTGTDRFTFGWWQLNSGFDLLPVLSGLFAVGTVLSDALAPPQQGEAVAYSSKGLWLRLSEWRGQAWNAIRSSVIGTWIGILPGIGAGVASVVSYSVAKNMSSRPEEFGKGSAEGIVASEAANNATVGGALIPLIALGIPGSVIDVFLMGAMQIHGIQPGPLLFSRNTDIVYSIIGACLTSTVAMFVLMMISIPVLRRVVDIPKAYVVALVLVFCVVGVFGYNNRWFEVGVMLVFGVIGFGMERGGFPLGPFVIGFILGPIAEAKLRSGLMVTAGDITPLFTRPLSASFLLATLVLLVWAFLPSRRRGAARAPGGGT